MLALIVWVQRLLDRGPAADPLGLATIRGYYLAVSRYLYEAAWDVPDFSLLDEDAFEDLYGVVLDCTTWSQRPVTAERLADFHATLRSSSGACAVDFHAVEPRVKGKGVRANLLTLCEYGHVRAGLPLIDRVLLSALFRLGLRPGELRRLKTSDLWLEAPPVLYVRSRRGERTKSPAGQRQIPLTGRLTATEFEELGSAVALARASDVDRIWDLAPPDPLARITRLIREVSGDHTLVPYHLRHGARTLMVLWACLPADALPPGAAPPPDLIQGPSHYRELHFGDATPTRRSLFQEAVIAGHAAPSTTLGVYTHLLDWICFQACLAEHTTDDRLLAHLTGLTTAAIRQIRHRACEMPGVGRSVVAHALKSGGLPLPITMQQGQTKPAVPPTPYPPRDRPASLFDVANALRLLEAGHGLPLVASALHYRLEVIAAWDTAAADLHRFSGFPRSDLRRARAFSGPALSPLIERLSQAVCPPDQPSPPWVASWLKLWASRYVERIGSPVIADPGELLAWIRGLVELGIPAQRIRLVRSRSIAEAHLAEMIELLQKQNLVMDRPELCARTVLARGAHVKRQPGVWATLPATDVEGLITRWTYVAAVAAVAAGTVSLS